MHKTYDIRKIEELHRLRADMYEERKHLTPAERAKISNEAAKRVRAEIEEMRQRKKQNSYVDG